MRSLLFLGIIFFIDADIAQAADSKAGLELYKQCIPCHGDKAEGKVALKAPRLSGQYDWYLLKQLKDMKGEKIRKNAAMTSILSKLSESDMENLASYISTL